MCLRTATARTMQCMEVISICGRPIRRSYADFATRAVRVECRARQTDSRLVHTTMPCCTSSSDAHITTSAIVTIPIMQHTRNLPMTGWSGCPERGSTLVIPRIVTPDRETRYLWDQPKSFCLYVLLVAKKLESVPALNGDRSFAERRHAG